MRLSDSLRVEPGQALAFIGAGGKTSAIARLVSELEPLMPTLVTTTTRLGPDQNQIAGQHILAEGEAWAGEVRDLLARGRSVLLSGEADSEGKWTSPPEKALVAARDLIAAMGGVFLIEADGARTRSLKSPAEHEPVVPEFVAQTILLAGLNALGKPLAERHVHRPELAGPIMELEQGHTIGIEHVARLLASPRGGLKGIATGSTVRCVLCSADSDERLEAGAGLARALLGERRFASVLLCDCLQDDPVRRVLSQTAIVVLAAGGSKRFGRQKLLESWHGEPIIRHVVRTALQAGSCEVVVVSGAEGSRLREALADFPVELVHNPNWAQGQSTSLRLGLQTVAARAEAVLFMLGDMPLVEPALLQALFDMHSFTLAPVIAPSFAGRPGNPVLFDRVTYHALLAIRGDQGGRAIYEEFPPRMVEWGDSAAFDVDSVEDLRRMKSIT
ncbi:MAG: selenium cofactor biosynthesis protein YqeC [Anaerolineales bacterium]|jgi:molybdenum cofactor cytidylyltransferase